MVFFYYYCKTKKKKKQILSINKFFTATLEIHFIKQKLKKTDRSNMKTRELIVHERSNVRKQRPLTHDLFSQQVHVRYRRRTLDTVDEFTRDNVYGIPNWWNERFDEAFRSSRPNESLERDYGLERLRFLRVEKSTRGLDLRLSIVGSRFSERQVGFQRSWFDFIRLARVNCYKMKIVRVSTLGWNETQR